MHAEQHFEYHRPIRVGEVISVETSPGASWEKEGRSGVLKFSEIITRYVDVEGNPVVTARAVAVTMPAVAR